MVKHDMARGGRQRWRAPGGTRKIHHGPGGRGCSLPWPERCHFYLKMEKETR